MKKLLALLVTAVVLVSLLAGCTPKAGTDAAAGSEKTDDAAPAQDVTITWGVYETDNLTAELYASVIDAFEADNPGIKVEKVLATGDDRGSFWKTLYASGKFPDIVLEGEILAATEGLFAEVPQDVQALFDPAALCTYNGKCVTIPYMKQLRMQCYYNKADFTAAGLSEPTTWEEFLNVCQSLKDAGKTPLICGGTGDIWATGQPWWISVTNQSIVQAHPDFNEKLKAGELRWDDPVIVQSMQDWQALINQGYYHEGCMSYSYAQAATEFQNGGASMMIDGSWAAAGFDGASNTDFGVFPVPIPGELKQYCSAISYWGVSEQCANKEAAFQFVSYVFSNPDVYGKLLQADGLYSTTKEPVTYEQGPMMNKFVENFADYELVPELTKVTGDFSMPAGFEGEVCKTLQNIFVGKDVAAELSALQSLYEMAKE